MEIILKMAKKGKVKTYCIAAYFRVSSAKQGLKGLGMDYQKKIVDDYVMREHSNCINDVKYFWEQESGASAKRPVLREAIEYCEENNCKLVVAKMDRLSRSVSFISRILDSKLEFAIAEVPGLDSKSPMGRAMLSMMATMAQLERDNIKDRTKGSLGAINAKIKQDGHYQTKGDPSKGIKGRKIDRLGASNVQPGAIKAAKARAELADKYIEANRSAIEDIVQLLAVKGKTSLRDIASALTKCKVATPREWAKMESSKDYDNKPLYQAKPKKWGASMVQNVKKRLEKNGKKETEDG